MTTPTSPSPQPGRRAALTRAVRATVGGSALMARNRAQSDRGLLAGQLLLITVLCFLTLSGPRLLASGADAGLQGAAERAGTSADVVARLPVSIAEAVPGDRPSDAASRLRTTVDRMDEALAPELSAVTGEPQAIFSAHTAVALGGKQSIAQYSWWSSQDPADVRWVEGGAPATPSEREEDENGAPIGPRRVGVAVSEHNAQALGLEVGQEVPVVRGTRGETVLVVSGVFDATGASDPGWAAADALLEWRTTRGADAQTVFGVMLGDDSLPDAALAVLGPAQVLEVRYPLLTDELRSDRAAALEQSLARTILDTRPLMTRYGAPAVSSALTAVLPEFQRQLRGAQAQASVVLAGLVLVGSLALLLAARLVLERRRPVLVAERARGASVASVALRLGLESVPLTALGFALALLGAIPMAYGAAWTWWPALIVAGVAAVAVPVGGAFLVARAWGGRQVPANRSDRERLATRRRTRRVVAEAAVVLLAVGAVGALRARGLLQSQTGGADLLLSATPALMAGAATVVALRVLPVALRASARAATRSRGLVAVVATARAAGAAGGGLPLLALAVCTALVVFSGSIAATVGDGQVRASTQQVGAEVRIDGPVLDDDAAQVLAQPGVSTVAAAQRTTDRTFNRGSDIKVTVLAADATGLDQLLDSHDERYGGELRLLDGPGGTGEPKAVVSPALADIAAEAGASIFHGEDFVKLDVVGVTDLGEPGELLVIVDRAQLAAASGEVVETSLLWVDGPGAEAAITAVGLDKNAQFTVTTRGQWLADARSAPLSSRLLDLLVASAAILAALASVTLALTVVASAPERGRTVSALRTLGLDARLARRITLGELLPLTVSAVLMGVVVGVAVPVMLHGALGLSALTGELRPGPVTLDWASVGVAIGASALALAVSIAVETAVRRRDRLGDVLRVGER
ncbi:hypothetical protein QUV83_00165 [Cellulomonas cellasea]|uniref:FtsX-like permease family protein n=1 Tax=Cellulomonas cellasea TaxID=43670 RepID=UPI0025A3FC87|nr:FtsX-like permease family protein [Cellulomonas cellasea]MDM8083181.1 hypothetical protein [Cellulomonas cellasea]